MTYRLGVLHTHPTQYDAPWYADLAARRDIDITVYYCARPKALEVGGPGFGLAFEWDVPLLDGYRYVFLENRARRPSLDSFLGCDTPEIAHVIEKERFDAFFVHGWHALSYWQAIRECRRVRTPILVRGDSTLALSRSALKSLIKGWTHRWLVSRFDGYLIVGQRAREYYLTYGADPDRMEFCPHAVDNDRFAKAAAEVRPSRDQLRRSWEIEPSAVVFLFCGKFVDWKRPLDFIAAVAQAAAVVPSVRGVMVGEGPMRPQMEAWARATHSPTTIRGFLNQTEIPTAYVAADVLVLPSNGRETWGLVVNEAMACGIPVILSDRVGCAPDLVQEGVTGYSFPFGDTNALAKQMIRLAQNPPLRRHQGTSAAERVKLYSVAAASDGLCRAVARLGRRSVSPPA